ncbi:acyltransferase family protein [Rhizorhabdus argentea]|uniref:acyltransferase family protein n=1 Tax=Rhizorhabdus argentea TaxID=1387174 RepID=UPI0030EDDB69
MSDTVTLPAIRSRPWIARRTSAPVGRLDSIQYLRAVAVLMVAFYHLTVLFREPHAARWAIPGPLYFGYAGVDLFFLISGFIIAYVVRSDFVDVRVFALKRMFRILPLYWLVTTVILIMSLLSPAHIAIRANSFGRFLLDSYLLLPTPERPLLGVGWTLQHEFQFYALVALLLLLGGKRFLVPALLAIFAAAVVLRVFVDPRAELFWDWKLLSLYSFEFALGVICYQINTSWEIRGGWVLIMIGIIGFIGTSAVITPLMGHEREVSVVAKGPFGLGRCVGFGLASFAILIGTLNLRFKDSEGFRGIRRGLLEIGNASFVIYLTHNLVIQLIATVSRKLPQTTPFIIAFILATVLMIATVGIVIHRRLEKPMLQFFETWVIPRIAGRELAKTPSQPRVALKDEF